MLDGLGNFFGSTHEVILHSLENENFIEAYWDEGEGKRKRKYYKITENGNKILKEKEAEWKLFSSTVNEVLGEGDLCLQ